MKFQRGASLTGYGLVVGLLAVVALVALDDIGGQVDGLFTEVGDKLEQVSSGAVPSPQTSVAPSPSPASFASCLAASQAGVTTSVVQVLNTGSGPFDAWCDMTPGSPGWTLVMRAAQNDSASQTWYSAGAINASASSTNFAAQSWKFADTRINALNGSLFRVTSDGSNYGAQTRYWDASSCTYDHVTAPAAGSACQTSWADEGLSLDPTGNNIYAGHGGLSDWTAANSLYFITADSRNGYHWFVGNGSAIGYGGSSGGGYGDYTAGSFQMWVR